MALTDAQKRLVRSTFVRISAQKQAVEDQFYARLFEIAPETRPLFKSDVKEQGMKLMHIISLTVMSLDTLDALLPGIRALGMRHMEYGVKMEHYAAVGDALMWALAQKLGDHWTPQVADAWAAVYTLLAENATYAYLDR